MRRIDPAAQFIRLATQEGVLDVPEPGLAAAASAVEDWDRVVDLARRHGVSGWVMGAAAGVPDIMPARSIGAVKEDVASNVVLSLALDRLLEQLATIFRDEDIPFLVLKGPAIATRYYARRDQRPYSDLDLLIPLRSATQVDAALQGLGLYPDKEGQTEARLHQAEIPPEVTYRNPSLHLAVDLHFDHFQVGMKPLSLEGIWERSETFSIGRMSGRMLGPSDLCLYLLVHLNKHGFERLIWFKDLDLILRSREAEIDWRWLAETARSEGVWDSVRYGVRLLQELFKTQVSDVGTEVLQLHKPSRIWSLLWSMDDVLNLRARPLGRRRVVQFNTRDSLRGVVPSLVFMGRRRDKVAILFSKLRRRRRGRPGSPESGPY